MNSFNFVNKNVDKNKLKRSLVECIEKNVYCIELLEEIEKKFEDVYKYTEQSKDKANLEMIQWVEFQIAYLLDMYEKQLKKEGGNPNAIQFTEWK